MRKAHIIRGMMKSTPKRMSFTVEKNTKKALLEVLHEIQVHSGNIQREKLFIYVVDAKNLSVDKMYHLVFQALEVLKRLDWDFTYLIQIDYKPETTESLSLQDFEFVRSNGSTIAEKLVKQLNESQLVSFIHRLNEQVEIISNSIKEQYDFYEEVLALEKEPVELNRSEKKFNFKTMQMDLEMLYKRCFNLVDRITNPHLSVNPSPNFQRALVWPLEEKQSFIDSLVNEIPIGAFYVNSDIHNPELWEGYGRLLWDGKQRMFALHSFICDEFSIEVQGKEVYYSQAPQFFNSIMRNTNIAIYESNFKTLREVIEAYISINSKQIKHRDEDLEHALSFLNE